MMTHSGSEPEPALPMLMPSLTPGHQDSPWDPLRFDPSAATRTFNDPETIVYIRMSAGDDFLPVANQNVRRVSPVV